jgi:hypothetical protein
MRCFSRLVVVAAAFVGFGGPLAAVSFAIFLRPSDAPIDRVIENIQARLRESPDDVEAVYTLARSHYLAFISKSSTVPIYDRAGRGDQPGARYETPPRWMTEGTDFLRQARNARGEELAAAELGAASVDQARERDGQRFYELAQTKTRELEAQNWQPEGLPNDKLVEHAKAALDNFNTAIRLKPDDAMYRLGLASLYQQYAEFREGKMLANEPAELAAITKDQALAEFVRAFDMKITEEGALQAQPIAGIQSLVSYEAGQRLVELLNAKGDNRTPEETEQLRRYREAVARLEAIPIRAMTPIVFSFEPSERLAELVDDSAAVAFDLDGNDVIEKWTWVKPETGILVWDPKREGKITSGRQMFGNVTWWLFFRDGYEALDTLDDNRDGKLAGGELVGLSVWFDRNTNGVSEPGEVVQVASLPIAAIATKSDGRDGESPMSSRGLVLEDGRVLPTYDWIAQRRDY